MKISVGIHAIAHSYSTCVPGCVRALHLRPGGLRGRTGCACVRVITCVSCRCWDSMCENERTDWHAVIRALYCSYFEERIVTVRVYGMCLFVFLGEAAFRRHGHV